MATQLAQGTEDQAEGFALRLDQALRQRGRKPGPTALEREFNLRYRGPPISVHAARKWLRGLAVPTQDKLQVLARWLDVSEEWLRWGHEPDGMSSRVHTGHHTPPTASQRRASYLQDDLSLQQDWRLLDARNQALVKSIIEVLLRDQRAQQDAGRRDPSDKGSG
jgi:hypothetical protein